MSEVLIDAPRVRVKICGLTRIEDVVQAAQVGADAIGLVFYPQSPRYVTRDLAARLAYSVPPFVTVVGLFVNAEAAFVETILTALPIHLLQFHGDEEEAYCRQFKRPYIKALRVRPGVDLLEYAARYPSATAILADAYGEGYGGSGKQFDWSLLPASFAQPLILSGGLDAGNVIEGIRRLRPAAVDVSSGVETSKGIKNAARMRAFMAAVRAAETGNSDEGDRAGPET